MRRHRYPYKPVSSPRRNLSIPLHYGRCKQWKRVRFLLQTPNSLHHLWNGDCPITLVGPCGKWFVSCSKEIAALRWLNTATSSRPRWSTVRWFPASTTPSKPALLRRLYKPLSTPIEAKLPSEFSSFPNHGVAGRARACCRSSPPPPPPPPPRPQPSPLPRPSLKPYILRLRINTRSVVGATIGSEEVTSSRRSWWIERADDERRRRRWWGRGREGGGAVLDGEDVGVVGHRELPGPEGLRPSSDRPEHQIGAGGDGLSRGRLHLRLRRHQQDIADRPAGALQHRDLPQSRPCR